ncbi:neuronal acetylcholine receptor subunit alpha-2-like [Musca vetustissima]|uniref:neuronal acetylcholine receptor subunit alpha-2-like n=1 Tax=Musca vetustissima TaxID=27455 RepID=UPI002AB68D03|nr:neuronal acetylcholine receptor subunit alpha-2-like [Musca vetustissima]
MFTSCRHRATIALTLFVVAIIQLAACTEDGNASWNISTMDLLRVQLFTNYDKSAHPMVTPTQRTNITLGISVNYIDIDELKGRMTLHGWINMRWRDGGRTWKPEFFDNITTLHIRAKEVWKPDITLFNSAGSEGDYVGDTQAMLSYDGSFLWVPPVVYTAYCNLNLKLWPYDQQTCKLKVGTWTLTTIDAKFLDFKESIDYKDLVKSTEWDIIDAQATYNSEEFYNYIEYSFTLQRYSSMYTTVIFTPASCIILMCLAIFWLPPQMGEKILLNAVLIVIIAAFLMYFAQMLPILAENTPLVVLFYSASLLLLSISTVVSVIVLYLSTAKHKQRVPQFLRNILNGVLGRILLLSEFSLEAEPQTLLNNGTKELGEHVYDEPVETTNDIAMFNSSNHTPRSLQFDWILLATAVDRICFLLYCLIFIILAIAYSV